MIKKNVRKLYKLDKKVIFCKKCTVSNQRPRTYFDKNGICSACNYAIYKRNKVDWNAREKQFKELCNRF